MCVYATLFIIAVQRKFVFSDGPFLLGHLIKTGWKTINVRVMLQNVSKHIKHTFFFCMYKILVLGVFVMTEPYIFLLTGLCLTQKLTRFLQSYQKQIPQQVL